MPTQSSEENNTNNNNDEIIGSDVSDGSAGSDECYDIPYNEMEYSNFFSQMLEDKGGANLDIHMKKLIEAIYEIKNILKEGVDVIKYSTEQNSTSIKKEL